MAQVKRPLIPLDKFPEHLRKFISEDTPLAAAKLVIQGLVPSDGAIKLCTLYQVAHLHEELYAQAGTALSQLATNEVLEGIKNLPPPIIDWIAEACARDGDCAAGIFAHHGTAVSTLMKLLSTANEKVATQLADNQVKLIGNVVLLQSLCLNPNLPKIVQQKLLELAEYQGVDLSWLPQQLSPITPSPLHVGRQTSVHSSANPGQIQQQTSAEKIPAPTHQAQANPYQKSERQVKNGATSLNLVTDEGRLPIPQRLDHPPLSLHLFPEQVQKFLAPDAPKQVLNLVLGGLFPMPTEIRVLALYHLYVTRVEVKSKSVKAIREMGISALVESCKLIQSPEVLDWLADLCLGADAQPQFPALEHGEDLVSALSINSQVNELTIARIALYTTSAGCERIATNQQRLLNQPSIIHSLYYNPQFSTVLADRLLELASREGVDLSWLPDASDVLVELQQQDSASQTDDSALKMAIKEGEQANQQDAAINAVLQEYAAKRASEEPEEEGKPKKGYALIQSLNVAQKIRLALLGSQSDRALLVKDSNKVVARAAIRSPAVSVSEALLYARNHSLNASIVEYIARNRKWMQNYRLKVQIVLNPKTPVNIALNALTTLRPAELRSVAQSHSISGVVSQRAKAIIKKRQG